MPYNIEDMMPDGLLIWLAKSRNMLSEDERTIYNSIRELEATLRNGADIEELIDKVKRTYDIYSFCNENRFKPYLHERIKKIRKKLDERIRSIE